MQGGRVTCLCRGPVMFYRPENWPDTAHTCPLCMRGLPCATSDTLTADRAWKASQPSLSGAIAAVIERTKAEPDFRSRETH